MHTINSVRLDRNAEIEPFKQEGIHSRPVNNVAPITINSKILPSFIADLEESGYLEDIVNDLQSLVDRDGIKLLTSCVSFDRFIEFSHLLPVSANFSNWSENGCNEVYIHFDKNI